MLSRLPFLCQPSLVFHLSISCLWKIGRQKSKRKRKMHVCIHWGAQTFSLLTRCFRLPYDFQHSTDSPHHSIRSATNIFLKVLWCQDREIMTRRHELPVRAFSRKSKKIKMKIRQRQSGGGKDGDWWWWCVCVLGGVTRILF